MDDKKAELLKKLKALAERGEAGERETARRKLEELMEKYGADEADLADEALSDHIEELEDNWTRRCDLTNLFPLSNGNHGIISALYKRDPATKKATQDMLRGIIAEHWKDTGGIEKVLSGLI